MRRIFSLVAIGVLAHTLAPRAQAPPTPAFRTETTLIEFTFVALDANGNPVTDLTKEDIVVTERSRHRARSIDRALPDAGYTCEGPVICPESIHPR